MWILKKKEVGGRLKLEREKRNLKSRPFARGAGIDPSQYSKIEKGELSVSERTMAKLVAKYNLNEKYILYGKNPPKDTLLEEQNADYHVPVKEKVETHEALLSVLISEVAALRASASGEHSEVIVKKIYKAAEDVIKLSKEE